MDPPDKPLPENPFSYLGTAESLTGKYVPDISRSWTPPAEVRLHHGEPISKSMKFSLLPPKEIGDVITAISNEVQTFAERVAMDGQTGCLYSMSWIAVVILVGLFAFTLSENNLVAAILVIPVLLLCLCMIVAQRRMYLCDYSFVGSEGIAIASRTIGQGKCHSSGTLFLYENCTTLTKWCDSSEGGSSYVSFFPQRLWNPIMALTTSEPMTGGFSIDLAWTKYLIRRVRDTLKQGEVFDFPFKDLNRMFRFFCADKIWFVQDGQNYLLTRDNVRRGKFDIGSAIDCYSTFTIYIDPETYPFDNGVLKMYDGLPNGRALFVLICDVLRIGTPQMFEDLLPKWHHGGL